MKWVISAPIDQQVTEEAPHGARKNNMSRWIQQTNTNSSRHTHTQFSRAPESCVLYNHTPATIKQACSTVSTYRSRAPLTRAQAEEHNYLAKHLNAIYAPVPPPSLPPSHQKQWLTTITMVGNNNHNNSIGSSPGAKKTNSPVRSCWWRSSRSRRCQATR